MLLLIVSCSGGSETETTHVPTSAPTATVAQPTYIPTQVPSTVMVSPATPTATQVPPTSTQTQIPPTTAPTQVPPTPTPTQLPVTPTPPGIPMPDATLEFSNFDTGQTNRGTIRINGHDRHFSITLPSSYNSAQTYPVVLFFHGCMCKPEYTKEKILSYLDWRPSLQSYENDFIVIKMSAYSDKKMESGDGGMWLWHEGLDRDDFIFVDNLIKALKASPDIRIDPDNIFGVGHSSGAILLMSFVLGGPPDLDNVLNDNFTFKAISVSGGSTLRKGTVDFKENTPSTLPSVLHIQGEKDKGLWFNGQETGKRGINFLDFAKPQPPVIIDGLRKTNSVLVYSAWDENTPSNPSTLERWATNLGLEYSAYEEYSQYYIYNFDPVDTSENVLIGMRIKDCGHGFQADGYQSSFFRIFSDEGYDSVDYDGLLSEGANIRFC